MVDEILFDLRSVMKYISQPIDQKKCNICWAIVITQCMQDILQNPQINLSPEYLAKEIMKEDWCPKTPLFDIVLLKILNRGVYCINTGKRYFPNSYEMIYSSDDVKRNLIEGKSVIGIINIYDGKYDLKKYQKGDIYGYPWWINGDIPNTFHGWHSVCIVGWGVKGNFPYWICRNSWGKNFGEDGYFKILAEVNCCGLGEILYTFKDISK